MLLHIVTAANEEPTLAILYQYGVHVPDNNGCNHSFSGVVVLYDLALYESIYLQYVCSVWRVCVCVKH